MAENDQENPETVSETVQEGAAKTEKRRRNNVTRSKKTQKAQTKRRRPERSVRNRSRNAADSPAEAASLTRGKSRLRPSSARLRKPESQRGEKHITYQGHGSPGQIPGQAAPHIPSQSSCLRGSQSRGSAFPGNTPGGRGGTGSGSLRSDGRNRGRLSVRTGCRDRTGSAISSGGRWQSRNRPGRGYGSGRAHCPRRPGHRD